MDNATGDSWSTNTQIKCPFRKLLKTMEASKTEVDNCTDSVKKEVGTPLENIQTVVQPFFNAGEIHIHEEGPFEKNELKIGEGASTTETENCTNFVEKEVGRILEQTVAQPSFKPGGIHSHEASLFWKNELNAGEWVLDVINNGYILPFNHSPGPYEEQNNASAKKHTKFVQKSITELLKSGIVKIVDKKPRCVSPLTVSEKTEPDGSTKLRLCWDGSRCVNLALREQKVTLSHLQRALEITEEGDFQVVYDLKSAFHHIKIFEAHTTYLGAAYTKEDGTTQYIVFMYLPFGLGTAVHCITKLFKPINAYLHKHGIRHTIFIDDGRILARSLREAEEDREFVYQTLKKAGWVIEERKSDKEGEANQVKNYLGFVIDTKQMSVRLRQDKKTALRKELREILSHQEEHIKVKKLAKITGKIISTEPALGAMPLMAARAAYIQQEQTVEEQGWNGNLQMTDETVAGLKYFLENLEQYDNTPIRTAANEISVLSIVGPPGNFIKTGFVSKHIPTENDQIWASDASGFATCSYSIKGDNLYYRGKLTAAEQMLSSGHRELLAVRQSLEYYSKSWKNRTQPLNIYWLTDSENLVRFLNKGSGKMHIQREIFRVMSICQRLKIRIVPIHLLRDDPRIQIADQGSKIRDTDDWSIDNETFHQLNQYQQFTIDLFASDKNRKCRRFYSNFFCPDTCGIDAFCHSWNKEVAWVCPPVKDVVKTVRKIRNSKMSGILFTPEWPTADFWLEIFNRQGELQWPFTSAETSRPFLLQENFNPKSPFHGHAKFNFLAITFLSVPKEKEN